ncbi:tryptophan-rich sensory protein [Nitratireductor sp. CAU 1489]|uniref:Tryptophan-rich sensory protein n=1 Tax=Nitratireductor arenosus TaxID=2682096 RepID=A0A844QKN6_9HYPH|nr:TspO/MBR family protein [Nitratireductor arenosus]MVA99144.1 tryptophan-rich sensory protein [Nitratireductor arenosus]
MVSKVDYRSGHSLLLLAAFLAVVIGVGALIGYATAPGAWYAGLQKPPFNPPNWIFGPAWFTLYALIAIAGWRTFLAGHDGTAMKLWYGQMALNWLWSPVFFALHLVWPAFVVIVAVTLLVVGFVINRWRADRLSAALFVPYAAWVGFAAILNLSIAILN